MIFPTYRQNLGRPGNSKIPDRLRFSRHVKTKLKEPKNGFHCMFQTRSHNRVWRPRQHVISFRAACSHVNDNLNKKIFCRFVLKVLASTQKLHLQMQLTSPKDFYFPYKVVCARALIASRVTQFLLKIAQDVLHMGLRRSHAFGLHPRLNGSCICSNIFCSEAISSTL